jgi:hypothetical protein
MKKLITLLLIIGIMDRCSAQKIIISNENDFIKSYSIDVDDTLPKQKTKIIHLNKTKNKNQNGRFNSNHHRNDDGKYRNNYRRQWASQTATSEKKKSKTTYL